MTKQQTCKILHQTQRNQKNVCDQTGNLQAPVADDRLAMSHHGSCPAMAHLLRKSSLAAQQAQGSLPPLCNLHVVEPPRQLSHSWPGAALQAGKKYKSSSRAPDACTHSTMITQLPLSMRLHARPCRLHQRPHMTAHLPAQASHTKQPGSTRRQSYKAGQSRHHETRPRQQHHMQDT